MSFEPSGSITATDVQAALESLSGVVNLDLRTFGATPAAARQGLQQAIDTAAFVAEFGVTAVVWVPPGTWQLDEELTLHNNVTLRGAGAKSVLRMDDDTDPGITNLGVLDIRNPGGDVENIAIENLLVDGNRANQSQQVRDAVHVSGGNDFRVVRNLRMRNLIIRNVGRFGIGLENNGWVGENIVIENISIENTGGTAMDVKSQGTRNCFITNYAANYFGQDFPAQSALTLRGTWTINGIDVRSVANDFHQDTRAIRFRQSGGMPVPNTRAGAVACVVRGVRVAPTGRKADQVVVVESATVGYAPVGNEIDDVVFRRANVISLTHGFQGGGGITEVDTAEATPPPNTLLLLTVVNAQPGSAPTPMVSGGGLKWELVDTAAEVNVANRISMFRAMGWFHSRPETGALTIDFGGNAQSAVFWRLDAIENVSIISSADAIVQSDNVGATDTAVNATLDPFDSDLNATYSTWAQLGGAGAEIFEQKNGYHLTLGDQGFGRILGTVWRPDGDTTPGVTTSDARPLTGIAVELRVARP